jgi:hypothetical protein
MILDVRAVYVVLAATVAAHAWIRSLVTVENVNTVVGTAVAAAVSSATRDIRDDIKAIQANTKGLPAWQTKVERRFDALEQGQEHVRE